MLHADVVDIGGKSITGNNWDIFLLENYKKSEGENMYFSLTQVDIKREISRKFGLCTKIFIKRSNNCYFKFSIEKLMMDNGQMVNSWTLE